MSAADARFLDEAEALAEGLRNRLLAGIRSWPKLSERDQRAITDAATDLTRALVRDAMQSLVRRGAPAVPVTVGRLSVDRTVNAKISAKPTPEHLAAMATRIGQTAMLVLVDPEEYGAPESANAPPEAAPAPRRRTRTRHAAEEIQT